MNSYLRLLLAICITIGSITLGHSMDFGFSSIKSFIFGDEKLSQNIEVCPDMYRELDINLPATKAACDAWYLEYHRQQYETASCDDEDAHGEMLAFFNSNLSSYMSGEAACSQAAMAGCGKMSVVSLGGVPGFPDLDELVVCSDADSLILLLYNNTQFPMTGVNITVEFDDGLTYGGFAYSYNNNATVAPFNILNPQAPVFAVSDIPPGGAVIAVLGVLADCNVNLDINNTLNLDAAVQYSYTDENNVESNCTETITEVGNYNAAVKVPVLNALTVSPSQLNLTQSNTPGCQTITISQDGIDAYVDDFTFQVEGLSAAYNITSVQVNGITVPVSGYTITGGNLEMVIGETYFPANTNDNNDNRFDEGERLTVRICFSVNGCINEDQFLTYKAFYGCNEDVCFDLTQKQGGVAFKPNYGANVVATSSVVQYAGICGDNLIYNASVRSANVNPVDGLWNDVVIKMNACLAGNLDIVNVTLNGVNLSPSMYNIVSSTISIDSKLFTSDIDGPGVGLEDLDGDGFFDDLPGGQTVNLVYELEIGCSQQLGCTALGCNITNIEVNGKRNCGQTFQQFGTLPTPISFFYGATSTATNSVGTPGYSIPITEVFQTTANVWLPTLNGYEFSYNFGASNVTPCP
ncbi:MAG TPA: hypothetical protein PKD51_18015, partial [Saprospiraceae bacterium]|nr:hypothetical protein [Saprospiraceae bacterium]